MGFSQFWFHTRENVMFLQLVYSFIEQYSATKISFFTGFPVIKLKFMSLFPNIRTTASHLMLKHSID